MSSISLAGFDDPTRHAEISDLIRRVSTNPADVRMSMLGDLDLSWVRTVLDLGCGFGFMTDAIAERISPEAEICGLDACAANERPYLERIGRTGRAVRFRASRIEQHLDWPDRSFDLVIASYSLYFFPEIVPEIARVLAPEGLFFTITHTEQFCRDLLRVAGVYELHNRLLDLIRGFSAESAEQRLVPWFGKIERRDYRNSLLFEIQHQEELVNYIRFKLPLITPGAGFDMERVGVIENAARTELIEHGRVALEKNDAAFRCRSPRCR